MKGTLLGFTWNNIHSSALGLTRISGGSEFSENLLPSFQDRVSEVAGADRRYYYGTDYQQREIQLNVAFNGLTEAQLRAIKILFADKVMNNLTLDEQPYKSYKVKLGSTPSISYNAFTEDYDMSNFVIPHNHYLGGSGLVLPAATAKDKVLKGTMTLVFIAYEPFGFSRTVYVPVAPAHYEKLKYKNQFIDSNNNLLAYVPEWKLDPSAGSATSNVDLDVCNYYEWYDSINLKNKGDTLVSGSKTYYLDTPTADGVAVYNPGDMETPFMLTFTFSSAAAQLDSFALTTNDDDRNMVVGAIKLASDEYGLRWNGKLQLLEGIKSNGLPSGRIYNRYILSGKFFTIVCAGTGGTAEIPSGEMEPIKFTLGTAFSAALASTEIDYDYRFF